MKKFTLLALICLFGAGCYSAGGSARSSSAYKGDKSFNDYYIELERQGAHNPAAPYYVDETLNTPMQSEEDRLRDIEIAAQKERRAAPPEQESDYIFNVMPDKSAYMFDERNQVLTDEPKAADYKNEPRLRKKPGRYTVQEYYPPEELEPVPAGDATMEDAFYDGA